ncbi:alpha/beta fold hydrolase [Flavitalea flava]
MKAYFISGIGADHRFFKYIRLPEGVEMIPINWKYPSPGESLADYAMRLSEQIDTGGPFVLVGLSLGGIMSVEIAKRIPPVCTILISSVPVSAQLPLHFRIAQRLNLLQMIPPTLLKHAAIIKRFISSESQEDKQMIRQMIRDGDNSFIKWAMQAVLEWKNDKIPHPIWHIHGTRDEVFPISLTHPTHIIPKGGHSLVISHPKEINRFLKEILDNYISTKKHNANNTLIPGKD